jgi:hypothetical protein
VELFHVELDRFALDPWLEICQEHGLAISLHVKPFLQRLWSGAGQYGGYVGCAFAVKAFGRVQDKVFVEDFRLCRDGVPVSAGVPRAKLFGFVDEVIRGASRFTRPI